MQNGTNVVSLLIVVEGALVVQKQVEQERSMTYPTKVNRCAVNPDRKFEWRYQKDIKVQMM